MSEFKAGDLVRYGSGSTALMQLVSKHEDGWHGIQCMGGPHYALECKLSKASAEDHFKWNGCGVYRTKAYPSGRQEPVIDFDGTDLAASGGVRTMQGVAFTDTPEATRDQQDGAGDAEQSAPEPIIPKDSLSINKLVNVIADPAHPKKSDVPDEADDATVEVVQIVVVASAIVSLVVTSIVIGISAAIWHAMN
ncbi:hypothetical protein XccvBFoX7_gp02c [Xanthomonas phage FoX7]|uniref:Uncharacterized protein n=2 Tax=Carpasinavirus XcP1 TaxID=2182344 RepID=A0A858NP49_9CAUD|nr:hypothetical protein XccvBFoX6_gp02c [Xanthomonas phage FoX6]QJB22159.1 hypothetical protein XccvBFoX7_gp02c [Xanthomonas phage FoX7]